MANRIHNLQQTNATFQSRGIVIGMKKKDAYHTGTTKSGGKWNSLKFGIEIDNNKTIFFELKGFTRNEVFYYKASENKGEKGTTVKVPWKNRKNSPGEGYRLIGVNITVDQDENGKNVNELFTEYDAVEYLKEHLKDGDSKQINGNIEFSSYVKNNQTLRSIKLNPTQIFNTDNEIDFDIEDFKEEAEFQTTLVFSGIESEMDENNKLTGRSIVSGYSIGYNNIENVSFIIDEEHKKVANAIKKNMKPGNAIQAFGRINVINNIETVVEEDDWGSTEISPMERINSSAKREYIIYKVKGETFDTETYSEKSIAEAIKAIKQAKEAETKFVVYDDSDDSGWGDDTVDDDSDKPWD